MPRTETRVLIVDDDTIDRKACRKRLSALKRYVVMEATSGLEGLKLALSSSPPDCILLDYRLPDITGLEFLDELMDDQQQGLLIPVIKLTGTEDATIAVKAMKRGASDYILKDPEKRYLTLLPAVIERVLEEQQLRQDKSRAEAKYRSLVEQIPAITYIAPLGEGGGFTYVSPQVAALGFAPSEWIHDPELRLSRIHPDDRPRVMTALAHATATATSFQCEYRIVARDGSVRWMRDEATLVRDDSGKALFLQGLLIDITADREKRRELRESGELLRQLAAHHATIREEERKHIAREVHDELGQKLTALQLEMSALRTHLKSAPVAVKQRLTSIMNLINDTMQSVSAIATDLRPAVLDLGLIAAIEWQIQQFQERTGISCTLKVNVEEIELEDERATALFRILQESLTNIAKHARASDIEVSLLAEGDTLDMRVQDNGVGITPESLSKPHSFGLLGMRERVLLLGGKFEVHGLPGRGTLVTVSVPIGLEAANA